MYYDYKRHRCSFLNVLFKCRCKMENEKHCFDKWIHQPQTGENSIHVIRWVLKRFITSYFPRNLTSAAQAFQNSLNQTKCGFVGELRREEGGMMGWNSLSSKLLFLYLYFFLYGKKRGLEGLSNGFLKYKDTKAKPMHRYFGMCNVRERQGV